MRFGTILTIFNGKKELKVVEKSQITVLADAHFEHILAVFSQKLTSKYLFGLFSFMLTCLVLHAYLS